MVDEKSIQLVARFKEGDEAAATELFERYLHRLIALARSRLSKKLARKVDPEDVVQSAYRSFFRGVEEGRLDIAESGKLWSLLAKITLFKVYRQGERYGAAKKNISQEQSMGALSVPPEQVARDPTPDEINGITEELQDLLSQFSERDRAILELHLQGHGEDHISQDVGRSTRTVRRVLAKVEAILDDRLTITQSDSE